MSAKPQPEIRPGAKRRGPEVRQVYSVRLPPALVERVRRAGGNLTAVVEAALLAWRK